jgi:galactan 5-O-arabinofuranosyltransferase
MIAGRLAWRGGELGLVLATAAIVTLAVHGLLVAMRFRAGDLVSPGLGPVWAAAMIAIGAAAVLADRDRRRALRGRLRVAVLAGAAVGLAMAPLMAGLLGTRQPPFTILAGDMAFRTESVTRFATTWQLQDYTFHGLRSFYPPAWFWAAGRAADWTGSTPWHVLKPFTIATIGAALLLSFCLWRMILRPGWALAAAIGSSLVLPTQIGQISHATEAWYSAYSCFVAVTGVAWVAAAWTTVRGPAGRGRLALLAVIGAVLALTYYLLFVLAIGVLLVLAVASPGVRRRALLRVLTLAGAIALLTAVFWIPLASAIIGGSAAQGHYVRSDFLQVAIGLNGPIALGVLVVAAIVALAATLREPASQAVAALLAGTIAYQLLSVAALVVAHQQLQPHRAVTMLWATLGAAVPVALGSAARDGDPTVGWRARWSPPVAPRALLAGLVAVVVLAVFGLGAAQGTDQASGPFSRAAHHPVDLAPTDAIARFITTTTGRRPQQLTVLSADPTLLVTRPFYGFLALKARYAHPRAQLGQRIGVLRAATACPDAACALRRLTRTPFGPIDAIVLRRTPFGLAIQTERDDFPEPTPITITFRPRLLTGPAWVRRDVGPYAVFARRPPA